MRRARARPTIRGRPHASLRPGSGGRLEAPTLPSSGPPRFFSALPPRGSAHFGRALCSGTEIRKPPVKFVFQRVFWERFWAELSGLGIVVPGGPRSATHCRAGRQGEGRRAGARLSQTVPSRRTAGGPEAPGPSSTMGVTGADRTGRRRTGAPHGAVPSDIEERPLGGARWTGAPGGATGSAPGEDRASRPMRGAAVPRPGRPRERSGRGRPAVLHRGR